MDLALRARLLERMARWAGNSVEWPSEFFSEKQHSQRLLNRALAVCGQADNLNLPEESGTNGIDESENELQFIVRGHWAGCLGQLRQIILCAVGKESGERSGVSPPVPRSFTGKLTHAARQLSHS